MTVHGSGYDLTFGAGTAAGHLFEGIRALKATRQGTYILGDDRVDFRLPTDIFDDSHYLLMRGVGFSGVRKDFDVVAFGGTMSTEYSSPFFNGAKLGDATGLLFLKRKLNHRWLLYSDTVISSKVATQIEALQWSPAAKTEVSFAAGVGDNHPYGAASLTMSRPRFDLKAAYILAGEGFHRIASSTLILAEPDRENISMNYRPFSRLSLTAGHQNYLVPNVLTTSSTVTDLNSTPLNSHSSVDEGSASLHAFLTQFSATMYHSSFEQPAPAARLGGLVSSAGGILTASGGQIDRSNHAAAFSLNRDLTSRLHLNASYLISKPHGSRGADNLITTFTEQLTSRLSVSEIANYSEGHTSVNFGGQFISNALSLSATYDTYYVPAQNSQPFEQALLIDVKFKVLGRLLLHGASFVDPTGRVRYTADASTVYSHDRVPKVVEHMSLGRYVLHGCVIDSDGKAVEGAAVMIDDAPLYTDSNGCFQMRENTARTHRMRVVMDEFLLGGNWQVVTMPTTVTSTTEDQSQEMRVIVVVRRVREVSSIPEKPVNQSDGTGAETSRLE